MGNTIITGNDISIGNQKFDNIRENDCFYVDKTAFIKEWWDSKDIVTLITRPRRFGKTLNMSMLNCFFPINMQGEVTCSMTCIYGKMKSTGSYRGSIL